jgi:hypothetical protein
MIPVGLVCPLLKGDLTHLSAVLTLQDGMWLYWSFPLLTLMVSSFVALLWQRQTNDATTRRLM